MVRDDILPHAASVPKDFVEKIMTILNKGSIHSTTSDSFIGKNLHQIGSSKKIYRMTMRVDPDQTASLGLYCLLRPICSKTFENYSLVNAQKGFFEH